MSIYIQTLKEFTQPLGLCNRIVPGTIFWRGLKIIHKMWWLKTRKERLFDQKDPGDIILKAIAQPGILQFSFIKTPAQFLMILVKIEEIFIAYNHSQAAFRAISQTWKGDFCLKKPTLNQRFKQTARKVYHYMAAYFCFVMTFIDVLDAVMFSKKSICEATFQIPENFMRVREFLIQDPEALQKKLYHHSKLIELIFKKKGGEGGNDVEAFIQEAVEFHRTCRKIQRVSRLIAQPIKLILNASVYMISGMMGGNFPIDSDKKEKEDPYRYCLID